VHVTPPTHGFRCSNGVIKSPNMALAGPKLDICAGRVFIADVLRAAYSGLVIVSFDYLGRADDAIGRVEKEAAVKTHCSGSAERAGEVIAAVGARSVR
jgi:hypothetical protein